MQIQEPYGPYAQKSSAVRTRNVAPRREQRVGAAMAGKIQRRWLLFFKLNRSFCLHVCARVYVSHYWAYWSMGEDVLKGVSDRCNVPPRHGVAPSVNLPHLVYNFLTLSYDVVINK